VTVEALARLFFVHLQDRPIIPMSYPPPAPQRIDLTQLGDPVYRGSVQHLYAVPNHPSYMVCQTTDAGSVFDVGSIFHIEGSDSARAMFRHAIYTRMAQPEIWCAVRDTLSSDPKLDPQWKAEMLAGPLAQMIESGAKTHHVGMIDAETGEVVSGRLPDHPSSFNVVRRFPVMTPPLRPLLGGHVFDYAQFHQSDTYVVPLEFIVRFGITSGSSVLRKYEMMSEAARRSYEHELGMNEPMHPWTWLNPPVFDLTSKYEPEDRNVSRQEALLMSGLSSRDFQATIQMALLGGYAVREVLKAADLALWDLKWEFAVDRDSLLFVDTIDSDSFRATRFIEIEGKRLVIHFNKQSMRDYYRLLHSDWFAAVNAAKAEAKRTGQAFKTILKAGQENGAYPATPAVNPEFLALQSRKIRGVSRLLTEPEAALDIREEIETCAREEIAFYQRRDRLEALIKVNGVDV